MRVSKEFKVAFAFKALDWVFSKFKKKPKVRPLTNLWSNIKWFKAREFDSPDQPGSGYSMNYALIRKLDYIRGKIGKPLVITSGYRTTSYNKKLRKKGYKAVKDSAHLKGLAVDIACVDSHLRFRIIDSAIGQGITRFGISKSYLHMDIDTTKNQNRMWL